MEEDLRGRRSHHRIQKMSQGVEEPINKTVEEEAGSAHFLFVNAEEDINKVNKTDNEGEKSPLGLENSRNEEIVSEELLNNTGKVFSCDKCSISFVSPIFLVGHEKRCRATRTDINPLDVKTDMETSDGETPPKGRRRARKSDMKYECTTCGRGFVRFKYLEAHEASHKTEFKCDKCPYTSETRTNLNRHMKVHYSDEEKIYACPHCSYTAGKSSYLRRHVAQHNEKVHKCLECPYETNVSGDLIRHVTMHKGGEKPFPCPHCYYSAAKKTHLDNHLQKFHSSETKT